MTLMPGMLSWMYFAAPSWSPCACEMMLNLALLESRPSFFRPPMISSGPAYSYRLSMMIMSPILAGWAYQVTRAGVLAAGAAAAGAAGAAAAGAAGAAATVAGATAGAA